MDLVNGSWHREFKNLVQIGLDVEDPNSRMVPEIVTVERLPVDHGVSCEA